jgi:CRISPR/Cas system Type II protein with McrA/HNH and RuvC-like nuclease domain
MPQPPKSKFVQLFERDKGRCVYCGMDLLADADRFMMATEDHLVPSSVSGKTRNLDNLILSCVVCNRLKANFVPENLNANTERREYIAAVRDWIYKRRSEKLKEFMKVTHPEQIDYQ